MYMSNADIIKEYKEAKDRTAQVKILADQNCCSEERIIGILADQNCCSEERIIGILVEGGIDHRCFSMLRRKRNQEAAAAAEKVVEKIPYKKPEIIPGPPHTVTLADAMAAIRAELDEINRQQYELDMRKADLYKQLWDMLGEVK